MILTQSDFYHFLELCNNKDIGNFSRIILPKKSTENNLTLAEYSPQEEYDLTSYRPIDPLRMLFYFPREKVYPTNKGNIKRLIVGAKACDLRALNVLDKALMEGDFIDPVYKNWREKTYIIGSDCEEIADTCHCTLLDGQPYPKHNYDINLSSYEDKFFLQIGSEKGEELLQLIQNEVGVEKESQALKERVEKNRENIVQKLTDQNRSYRYGDQYEQLRNVPRDNWWEDQEECIGCGACTNICPTCYCMILNDESTDQNFIKVRSQDSCQLHGYSKVAGGESPRPKMRDRFRNRYLCKFEFMQNDFEELGCVGCGRCIDCCAGEIDIREVMQNMLETIQEKA